MTDAAARSLHRGNSAMPGFWTIDQIADHFEVSSRTVWRWVKRGDLPVHRFGSAVRVSDSDLRAFIALHRDNEVCGHDRRQ